MVTLRVVTPYHSRHKVPICVSDRLSEHEGGGRESERHRDVESEREVIIIAAAADADDVATCVLHLYEWTQPRRLSNQVTGLTPPYLVTSERAGRTASARHQKYRGNQTVAHWGGKNHQKNPRNRQFQYLDCDGFVFDLCLLVD